MSIEKIILNNKEYKVNVTLENRNNARVSIGRRGINIRMPLGLPREEQFRKTRKLIQWAKQRLEEKPVNFIKKGSKEYQDNQILKVGEVEYLIRISKANKNSSSARIKENNIYLNISNNLTKEIENKHVSVLLSRIIAHKELPNVVKDIRELNQKYFNFSLSKIFLKYNQSNWGSCSSQGNINISTRLLFAPKEARDYVCVHELAHLKEKNHSENFWKLVESAMPDYREKEKWLKENRDLCWF